jgi:DNA polymerase I-like protein with 3'-5' exonuclease and polymerase domains
VKVPSPVVIDFESGAIQRRPKYPPEPCSASIVEPGKKPVFLAWAQQGGGNNCTKADARRHVLRAWKDPRGVCFHNGKFDVDVGETHLGMPRLSEDRIHDTVLLAFLANPDRAGLNLQKVATEELKIKEWKEGKLKEWILANVPEARQKPSTFGAYISRAPADVVRPRAVGDAQMTARLFDRLYRNVARRGMLPAYRREQRLMLPLLESERRGIRVNLRLMKKELPLYEWLLERCDWIIRRELRSPGLDVDKREELADALDKAGFIEQWQTSAAGKRLTNKKVINNTIKASKRGFIGLLSYRSALATSVRTFMRPWTETALETGGLIHTQWNQVRSDYHGSDGGARTGRLSSSPNFQNIPIYTRSVLILPKLLESGYMKHLMGAETFKRFPWAARMQFTVEMADKSRQTFRHACPLPMMKAYVLPYGKDDVLIERDYSQQEFRILAHYEDGPLLEKYRVNPTMDVHDAARDLIQEMTGTLLDRRPVKDVGFSLIYGMGLDELARKVERTRQEAKELKAMYLGAMPGLADLQKAIKAKVAANEPIVTWGGRQYFCEPPSYNKKFKRWMEYSYKLINRLIQGSAADATKEGTARWHELPESKRHGGRFLMTVHDSTVGSAPRGSWQKADAAMREAMESVEFDVPLLTDGKWGENLSELKKIKDAR